MIKQHIYDFLLKFILSVRLRNSLWGSDVLLFLEFINIVFILFYNFVEFIMLFYTILEIYFAWYKEYMIWRISFSKCSDILPVFTLASAIGNLWSIWLGVSVLNCLRSETLRSETLATRAKSNGCLLLFYVCVFIDNILLSEPLRTFCLLIRNLFAFLKVNDFFSCLSRAFCFIDSLNLSISFFNLYLFFKRIF